MQTTIKITSISKNLMNNNYSVTFETDYIDDLKDIQSFELDCKLTKARKKRSKDQNRLMWEFIDKIAEKTGLPRTEIYKNEIKEVGGISTTMAVKNTDVHTVQMLWQERGLGWITETFPSKLKGCQNITLFKGSSAFNTEEMTRMIDLVIQDAEALGIDTTPLREISLYEGK